MLPSVDRDAIGTVSDFCLGVLRSGDLASKLAPPGSLDDGEPDAALAISPCRAPEPWEIQRPGLFAWPASPTTS
jgi:hypothetical protein